MDKDLEKRFRTDKSLLLPVKNVFLFGTSMMIWLIANPTHLISCQWPYWICAFSRALKLQLQISKIEPNTEAILCCKNSVNSPGPPKVAFTIG